MLTIGGDDTIPAPAAERVLVTIFCDGESLFCHPPIVVPGTDVASDEWPTEVASKRARARGWRLIDSDSHGRTWLCPSCRRK